jgi:hypothetical protein
LTKYENKDRDKDQGEHSKAHVPRREGLSVKVPERITDTDRTRFQTIKTDIHTKNPLAN